MSLATFKSAYVWTNGYKRNDYYFKNNHSQNVEQQYKRCSFTLICV